MINMDTGNQELLLMMPIIARGFLFGTVGSMFGACLRHKKPSYHETNGIFVQIKWNRYRAYIDVVQSNNNVMDINVSREINFFVLFW